MIWIYMFHLYIYLHSDPHTASDQRSTFTTWIPPYPHNICLLNLFILPSIIFNPRKILQKIKLFVISLEDIRKDSLDGLNCNKVKKSNSTICMNQRCLRSLYIHPRMQCSLDPTGNMISREMILTEINSAVMSPKDLIPC